MMQLLRRGVSALLLAALLLSLCPVLAVPARATEEPENSGAAQDISDEIMMKGHNGFGSLAKLVDGNELNGELKEKSKDAQLTVTHYLGLGSLYLIFGRTFGEYTVTDAGTGEVKTVGQNNFLREFIDLVELFGHAPQEVVLTFPNGVYIHELEAYTEGTVPDTVQRWQVPQEGKTDLVLFSTHGDDEQLFFAGVLPYYARERGYQVQVVYLVNHAEAPMRQHEILNGLWSVGVTTYPVLPAFPDFRVDTLDLAYANYKHYGLTKQDLLSYVVEQIRRFKPKVAVAHDIKGEYGHVQHVVYTELVREAVEITNDPSSFPESAEKYGLWDIPKTYIHLYAENPIVIDFDQPLESFGGKTAFEVTRDLGYACHKSQHWTWFTTWIKGSKTAAGIRSYNPCKYGLYRSTVGEDVEKNDFFENMLSYAEQEKAEEEARLEAERIKAEEEAKRQAEEEARRKEEERLRAEAEAKQKAEEERLEAERQKAEEAARKAEEARKAEQEKQKRILYLAIGGVAALLVLILTICIIDGAVRARRRRRRRRRRMEIQKKYQEK